MDILLVDDDTYSARMLRDVLVERGHIVRLTGDGKQALALAVERRPELVITDIEMPVMNGIELLKEVKRQMPDVFVILMTGLGGANETGAAFQHGADGFLQKPVKLESLLAGIRRIEACK